MISPASVGWALWAVSAVLHAIFSFQDRVAAISHGPLAAGPPVGSLLRGCAARLDASRPFFFFLYSSSIWASCHCHAIAKTTGPWAMLCFEAVFLLRYFLLCCSSCSYDD